MIRYNLEELSTNRIRGWAVDIGAPHLPLRLSLEVANKPFYTFYAVISRLDVVERLGIVCNPGFDLFLPPNVVPYANDFVIVAYDRYGERSELGKISNENCLSCLVTSVTKPTLSYKRECIAIMQDTDKALDQAERLSSYSSISQVFVDYTEGSSGFEDDNAKYLSGSDSGYKINFMRLSMGTFIDCILARKCNMLFLPSTAVINKLNISLMTRITSRYSNLIGCIVSPVSRHDPKIDLKAFPLDHNFSCIPFDYDIVFLAFDRISTILASLKTQFETDPFNCRFFLDILFREAIYSGQFGLLSRNPALFAINKFKSNSIDDSRYLMDPAPAKKLFDIIDISSQYRRSDWKPIPEGFTNSPKSLYFHCVLYVLGGITGGVGETTLDLVEILRTSFHCLILSSSDNILTLYWVHGDRRLKKIGEYHLSHAVSAFTHVSCEYDSIFADIIDMIDPCLVHVRSLVRHSLGISRICKEREIPLIHSFHDYYAICPSHNLLNSFGSYCQGHCSLVNGNCDSSLFEPKELPELKDKFVYRWRAIMIQYLEQCSVFVTTSKYTADRLIAFYPIVRDIRIIEHGRDLPEDTKHQASSNADQQTSKSLRLVAIGALNKSKGAKELEQLLELSERDNRISIDIYGKVDHSFRRLHRHSKGAYTRDSIIDILRQKNYDAGLLLSKWPETYCHTLTEYWFAALPVIALNCGGAVAERMERSRHGGWLLGLDMNTEEIWRFLIDLLANKHQIENRKKKIAECQEDIRTASEMALEYKKIYDVLVNRL